MLTPSTPFMQRVDFGQGPIYLDATDPGLAFGQLQPGFEGMAAVVPELRKPETLELPKSDPAASDPMADRRHAGRGRLRVL